jgi:hypothetical protein
MAIGYRDRIISEQKRIRVLLGVRYIGYGSGSDDEVGNFMQWDVNYLRLKLVLTIRF